MERQTYYIKFVPGPKTLMNGNNPLFIIGELQALGKCKVMPHFENLKTIDDLDMTVCYSVWELFLVTDVSKNDIVDVFVFVEGDSEVQVEFISDHDILDQPIIIQLIERKKDCSESPTDLDLLKQIGHTDAK